MWAVILVLNRDSHIAGIGASRDQCPLRHAGPPGMLGMGSHPHCKHRLTDLD